MRSSRLRSHALKTVVLYAKDAELVIDSAGNVLAGVRVDLRDSKVSEALLGATPREGEVVLNAYQPDRTYVFSMPKVR